jgi:hypothetical protein
MYRTEIRVELLSEEPFEFESLDEWACEIMEGATAGQVTVPILNETVHANNVAPLLKKMGHDPNFFEINHENE